MKIRNILLAVFLLLASLSIAPVTAHADDENNVAMGTYISQANSSLNTSLEKSAAAGSPTVQKAAVTSATTPDILNSNDKSLPRQDAIDISSYQYWMTQADFNAVKAAGVKTVIVKLTEGTYYTNPYAKSQIQMARNAGLSVATYHYVDDPTNIKAEASYYTTVANSLALPKNTAMIEDAEAPGTTGNDWTTASKTFKSVLNNNGYTKVVFYTSLSWATSKILDPSVLGYKNMWIAQYLYGSPSASNLQNTAYGAWQFSSQMRFQGTANLKGNNLDVSIDYANLFSFVLPTPPTPPSGYKNVFRLYNSRSKEHLYTTDRNEAQSLPNITSDWTYEGNAWFAPNSSSVKVYRVYNPKSGEHLYTKDGNEVKVLTTKNGWKNEGLAFYSGGNSPIYRLYNPNAGVGSHFVTKDANEMETLRTRGWKYEGIAWYAN